MNTDTGEIYHGAKQAPHHVELTHGEARFLGGQPAKERVKMFHRLRRQAIKAAKRDRGRRLNDAEMNTLVKGIRDQFEA